MTRSFHSLGTLSVLLALPLMIARVAAQDIETTPHRADSSREEAVAGEMHLGFEALKANDLLAARAHFGRAVTLSRQLPSRSFAQKAEAIWQLASILSTQRDYRASEELYRECLVMLEQAGQTQSLFYGWALFNLESHYAALNDIGTALAFANRAVSFYSDCVKAGEMAAKCDRGMADVQGLMGCALLTAKRYGESEAWLQPVVARRDEAVRTEVMLPSLWAWSIILQAKGEPQEARNALARWTALKKRTGSASGPQ